MPIPVTQKARVSGSTISGLQFNQSMAASTQSITSLTAGSQFSVTGWTGSPEATRSSVSLSRDLTTPSVTTKAPVVGIDTNITRQ